MASKVSVIIPCFNQGEYIVQTVDSVLKQTYKDVEIIIVNDGSTDNTTKTVIDGIVNDHPQIIALHTKNNGLATARNIGIGKATGKYILPLDSDDMIGENYISKAVKILDERPKVGIVYSRAKFFGEQTGEWQLQRYSRREILETNMIFCSSMFRKKDWASVGGYNPNMKDGLEDWDLWLSLIESGKDVYKINDILFFYRKHGVSMVSNLGKSLEDSPMYKQIRKNHFWLFMWHAFMIRVENASMLFIRLMSNIPHKLKKRTLHNAENYPNSQQ